MNQIKNYICRKNDKVFFIKLEVGDDGKYKLRVDIRRRLTHRISDIINDHKEVIKILESDWLSRKDNIGEEFWNLYRGASIDHFMFKVGHDLTILLNIYPEFNNAPFFDRLHLEGIHNENTTTLRPPNFKWLCRPNTEYWIMCDLDMNITVKISHCYYQTLNTKCEHDIKCYDKPRKESGECELEEIKDYNPDEYLYTMRMLCKDEYPRNKIYGWILNNIISFYCPLIMDRLTSTNYFTRVIAKLITDYVIS